MILSASKYFAIISVEYSNLTSNLNLHHFAQTFPLVFPILAFVSRCLIVMTAIGPYVFTG